MIDLQQVKIICRQLASSAKSPYETGFVTVQYKKALVELKWWLEDLIDDIGYFQGEEQWEQERLIQLLKRKENNETTVD